MSDRYHDGFFDRLEEIALRSAREVVPMLVELVGPSSVVDLGCARGAWLRVFRENGVDASLSIVSWPAFFVNVQESRHEIALLGWTNIVDPDRVLYAQFSTDGDLNYGRYSNPEVDALLARGRAALDRTDRKAAYTRVAELLADEVPYYVLSYQSYQLFHRPDLTPDADPRGFMRSVLGLKAPTS